MITNQVFALLSNWIASQAQEFEVFCPAWKDPETGEILYRDAGAKDQYRAVMAGDNLGNFIYVRHLVPNQIAMNQGVLLGSGNDIAIMSSIPMRLVATSVGRSWDYWDLADSMVNVLMRFSDYSVSNNIKSVHNIRAEVTGSTIDVFANLPEETFDKVFVKGQHITSVAVDFNLIFNRQKQNCYVLG